MPNLFRPYNKKKQHTVQKTTKHFTVYQYKLKFSIPITAVPETGGSTNRESNTHTPADLQDWIEQGLTSPPTQYRLCGRQFYRSKDPTNSIKVLKEKLTSHSTEEVQNTPGASHRVTSEPLKKRDQPSYARTRE